MNSISRFMKPAKLVWVLLIATLFNLSVIAEEILSNQSVIALTGAKMGKDLIINKIHSTANNFDMSAAGIIGLKDGKVADQVVVVMLSATKNLPQVTNDDVIAMKRANVSQDVILKKIEVSRCNFKMDTESMIALKNAKVNETIQKAMMAAPNAEEAKNTAPTIENPTPDIARFAENGIYVEEGSGSKIEYAQLEPTTTNNTKGGTYGEFVGNRMTGGLSGSTNKVGLANPSANLVTKENRPVFYFIFSGNDRKDMNNVKEDWFNGVASPNDFVLVRAEVSKKGRQITIGRHTSFTNETGFTKGTYPFKFKKINTQMYRVYLEKDLPAGEYAFYYNKGSLEVASLKLYDFSVQNNVPLLK